MIQMEFSDDVNMDAISVDIRDKISQIEGNLPETAGTPVVMKISTDMMPVVTAAVGMKGKPAGEVSRFVKEELQSSLSGVEGVASVSTMGMVSDNIQIVLSQEKIDEINQKISAAISSSLGEAESQITSGMGAAASGKQQIRDGKEAIAEGQRQAAEQLAAMKKQLTDSRQQLTDLKKQGPALKLLLKEYDNAVASGNQTLIHMIEQQIEMTGMTVDTLRKAVAQLDTIDEQIAAVDAALKNLEVEGAAASFTLGNRYADLAAAESTIDATVNQLQSALSQVQSSQEAALASADMTGVLTMSNISAILSAQNFSMPAGYIEEGEDDYLVRVGDKLSDGKSIEDLVLLDLGMDGLDPIRVRDVADVTRQDDSDTVYARLNGKPGVMLTIEKQTGYSTGDVTDRLL